MEKFKTQQYRLLVFVILTLFFMTTGCKEGKNRRWRINNSDLAISFPTVIAVTPLNNATDVAINSDVTATFSEEILASTLNTSSFTLVSEFGTPITGVVTYVNLSRIATFSPDSNLLANTLYTATITTQVTDLTDNPLASDFVWVFTTGSTPDTTAPRVVAVAPLNNVMNVPFNTNILATFNEEMLASTINTSSFTLVSEFGIPITGIVTYVAISRVATFSPDSDLLANTLYNATITTQATDLADNSLASDFVWSFTTGATLDATTPTVTAVTPLNNAVGVTINSDVTATFSEEMLPSTINIFSFTLVSQFGIPVVGVVTYVTTSRVTTFSPTNDLLAGTLYTATITTQVTDLGGECTRK